MLSEQRIARSDLGAWRGVVGNEHADGPWSVFAGQTRTPLGVHDTAGEEQRDRSLEIVGVLQEERTLLRELDFEALVYCDLGIVGFDLAEIGIRGRIEHKLVFHDSLCVQTDLPKRIALSKRRMVQVAQVNVTEGTKDSVRDELKIVSGRNILKTGGVAFLI